MIRTDIDIKDDIYKWLKGSALAELVSGGLYKDSRPLNSEREDITIAVLARDAGPQMQEATVNVNVYVPDIRRGQEAIEDSARLREVARVAAEVTEYHFFGDGIYTLSSQEILKANGADWHIVNNRLRVQYNNEDSTT